MMRACDIEKKLEEETKSNFEAQNIKFSSPRITTEIQEIVKQRVENGYAPAIAMAVVDKNNEEYYEYGGLNYQASAPKVSNQTLFEIGSITKTFTGVLLADAILQKKMDIDDSIAKYFPDLKNLEKITLRHLVTHSSGLPEIPDNFVDHDTTQDDPWKNYSDKKLFEWLRDTSHEKLLFTPGSKWSYSNAGVALLGCLLSEVYKKPYETLISDIILEPLEMTSTYFASSMTDSKTVPFAMPHFEAQEVPAWNLQKNISAAGGLRSTTQDLTKYIKAHLGITHKETRIGQALALSHSVLFKDDEETMGYGIASKVASACDGHFKQQWLYHSGGTGGSAAFLILDLEQQLGGIILYNAEVHKNGLILQGAVFPEKLPEALELMTSPAVISGLDQSHFSSFCGEYRKKDCLVTITSKNETLVVTYNHDYPTKNGTVTLSSHETFYPSNDHSFFSKSCDNILKISNKTDDKSQFLTIGDDQFERIQEKQNVDEAIKKEQEESKICEEALQQKSAQHTALLWGYQDTGLLCRGSLSPDTSDRAVTILAPEQPEINVSRIVVNF